jgi:hypothetical protein
LTAADSADMGSAGLKIVPPKPGSVIIIKV